MSQSKDAVNLASGGGEGSVNLWSMNRFQIFWSLFHHLILIVQRLSTRRATRSPRSSVSYCIPSFWSLRG